MSALVLVVLSSLRPVLFVTLLHTIAVRGSRCPAEGVMGGPGVPSSNLCLEGCDEKYDEYVVCLWVFIVMV